MTDNLFNLPVRKFAEDSNRTAAVQRKKKTQCSNTSAAVAMIAGIFRGGQLDEEITGEATEAAVDPTAQINFICYL